MKFYCKTKTLLSSLTPVLQVTITKIRRLDIKVAHTWKVESSLNKVQTTSCFCIRGASALLGLKLLEYEPFKLLKDENVNF